MHARLAVMRARLAGWRLGSMDSPPSPGAILRTHSRSTRVGRGGSNYWLVVAVAAPVLWRRFYGVFIIFGVPAERGPGVGTPGTTLRGSRQQAAAICARRYGGSA